jgi:hypothetical protein
VADMDVTAKFRADISDMKSKMDQMTRALNQINEKAQSTGKGFTILRGSIATAFGAGVVGLINNATSSMSSFMTTAVDMARESELTVRRLDAIAQSMGLLDTVLGGSTKRLTDYAQELQNQTAVSDETIKAAQALILTFKDVAATAGQAGGVFDRTTVAALDLAAAGFGSVEGNARSLARALQDPAKGLTMLGRQGVTFTDSQKEMILMMQKSGDTLGAQNAILQAVEQQVGGTAAATATGAAKMSMAFKDVQESIGLLMLPAIDSAAAIIQEELLPAFADFVEKHGPQIEAFMTGLVSTFADIGRVIVDVAKFFTPLLTVFGKLPHVVMLGVAALILLRTAFATQLTAASASVARFSTTAAVGFKRVGVGASTMALHVGAAMTSKKVALEMAALSYKKMQIAAITSFRVIGAGIKTLLTSLGPIGIAIIGATAAMEFFMGRSQAAAHHMENLRDEIDATTGSLSDLGQAFIASELQENFSAQTLNELRELGYGMGEITAAIEEGGEAFEAMISKIKSQKGGELLGDLGQETVRRTLEGMREHYESASEAAREAAKVQAEQAEFASRKEYDAFEVRRAQQRKAADEHKRNLANMTVVERAALEERTRAAKLAADAQTALNDATAAGVTAAGRMQTAFATLNNVLGNTQARRSMIEGFEEIDKKLGKTSKSLKDNTKAGRENNQTIEDQAKKIMEYASAADHPAKQNKRLAEGYEELVKAMEAKGLDPEKSAIMRAMKRQVEESKDVIEEFEARIKEAREKGVDVGRNFIVGILEALRNGKKEVRTASADMATAMPDGANEGLDAQSPSKKGMKVAKNFIDGIALGLKQDKLFEKASDLAKGIVSAFEEEMRRIEGIVESAMSAGATFAEMVAQPFGTASQVMQNFGKTAGISSIVSGVKEITRLVREAYAPLVDRELVGAKAARRNRQAMNDQLGTLQAFGKHAVNLRNDYELNLEKITGLEKAYGRRVDGINAHFDRLDDAAQASVTRIENHWKGIIPGLEAALKKANDAYDRENRVLEGLVSARDSFLRNIASGFRGFVNELRFAAGATSKVMQREMKKLANGITVTLEREIEVGGSPQNIAKALQERLSAVRDFSANIRTLMARGLDPTLVQDFVSAGVSGAGEAAAALVQASDGELRAINETQAALASEVAAFSQYASQQWFDAGIAQQEAIVAPLKTAAEAAQAALNTANESREKELTAARNHVEQLRKDRKAALDRAKVEHEAEIAIIEGQNRDLQIEMDALAERLETMLTGMAMRLPPQAFQAGQRYMRQLRAGFVERFPIVSGKLNALMDQLAASMNRVSTITVRTVYESIGMKPMAKGGSVSANSVYLVGEKGPEIFVPGGSGSIIPNHQIASVPSMGAMGGVRGGDGASVININVNVPVSANKSEIGREIVEAINQFERVSGTSWRG